MSNRATTSHPVLPDVTLVAVTSVAINATIDALHASMRQASFAQVLLLTDHAPAGGTDPSIHWRRIEPIGSREDYSRFMLQRLHRHVSTSHALCVQWDGFVLNGAAWEAEFLKYDYLGAVWPQFTDGRNVGNGGFSLRSRRLLEATEGLPFDGSVPEDVAIGRLYRTTLERQGIRFAPEQVARRFAYERTPVAGGEFGFHGVYNLGRHLTAADALALLRSLEPTLLAPNERLELLRWAAVHGYGRIALEMIARMRQPRPPSRLKPDAWLTS